MDSDDYHSLPYSNPDGFTKVTNRRRKNVKSVIINYKKVITTVNIDVILNIFDLFNYIFSFTDLVNKLEFRLVSRKCRTLIDNRLRNKFLCDDLDEFIFYVKDDSLIKKFIGNEIFNKYLLSINNSYVKFIYLSKYDTVNIIEYLLTINSIFFLKKFINSFQSFCLSRYICYYTLNGHYNYDRLQKKTVNKYILNEPLCENNIYCESCSQLMYLCAENNWYVPNIFFNNVTHDKIFDLMIIAGCHGSFNIFIVIYNYLKKNSDDYLSIGKMHIVSTLVCYYRNYFMISLSTKTSEKSSGKLFNHTLKNIGTKYLPILTSENYDRIIKWLCDDIYGHKLNLNVDDCISKILKNSNQKYILTSLHFAVDNCIVDDVIFFEKIGQNANLLKKKYSKGAFNSFLNIVDKDLRTKNTYSYLFHKYYSTLYTKIMVNHYLSDEDHDNYDYYYINE